jgi:hypothetical protein
MKVESWTHERNSKGVRTTTKVSSLDQPWRIVSYDYRREHLRVIASDKPGGVDGSASSFDYLFNLRTAISSRVSV